MKCLSRGTEIQEGAQFSYRCRAPNLAKAVITARKTTERFRAHWAIMTVILGMVPIIILLIAW